ncbi:MAG: NGG1p interacting factor NIF3 [Desulfamplus sp.]|nr:NGG1p interacting factor NIF3 [Desulfamplus sp.]
MYLISFYVPESHLQAVTSAMFNKGAGRIGNYDSCAWYTKGFGQFRPLEGSSPFVGKQDKIEHLSELKVEMVCEKHLIKEVLQELIKAHPYETPAYHAVEILTLTSKGLES